MRRERGRFVIDCVPVRRMMFVPVNVCGAIVVRVQMSMSEMAMTLYAVFGLMCLFPTAVSNPKTEEE